MSWDGATLTMKHTCCRSNHNKTDFKMIFIQTGATNPPPPLNLCYFTFSLPLKTRYLRLETNYVIIIQALHNSLPLSLTHGYLFELQKEAISMEMQCLHAWKKTIICHFEKCFRALLFPGFLLHFACSIFLLVILFFFPCAHPEEKKNKQCKCPCA